MPWRLWRISHRAGACWPLRLCPGLAWPVDHGGVPRRLGWRVDTACLDHRRAYRRRLPCRRACCGHCDRGRGPLLQRLARSPAPAPVVGGPPRAGALRLAVDAAPASRVACRHGVPGPPTRVPAPAALPQGLLWALEPGPLPLAPGLARITRSSTGRGRASTGRRAMSGGRCCAGGARPGAGGTARTDAGVTGCGAGSPDCASRNVEGPVDCAGTLLRLDHAERRWAETCSTVCVVMAVQHGLRQWLDIHYWHGNARRPAPRPGVACTSASSGSGHRHAAVAACQWRSRQVTSASPRGAGPVATGGAASCGSSAACQGSGVRAGAVWCHTSCPLLPARTRSMPVLLAATYAATRVYSGPACTSSICSTATLLVCAGIQAVARPT